MEQKTCQRAKHLTTSRQNGGESNNILFKRHFNY